MNRIFRFAAPVAIQAAGSAATFVIAILVTRFAGIEEQGEFSFVKSWTDTLLTGLLFGLPQWLLHLSYQGERSPPELYGFSLRYALALTLLGGLAAAVAAASGQPWIVWIVLAIPLLVFHGLVRSLLLRQSGTVIYAWVTVLPSLALLVAVVTSLAAGDAAWGACIFVSAVASALVSWALARQAGWSPRSQVDVLRIATSSVNLHAFVQNILPAAQSACLLSLAGSLGASTAGMGELSLSLIALQVSAIAAGFGAPVIYNAFDPVRGLRSLLAGHIHAMVVAIALLSGAVGFGWILMPSLLLGLFKVESASAILACRLALLAGVILLCNRVMATLLQRAGQFALLSRQSASRFALCLAAFLVFHARSDFWPSEAGAMSILMSEATLLIWTLRSTQRLCWHDASPVVPK